MRGIGDGINDDDASENPRRHPQRIGSFDAREMIAADFIHLPALRDTLASRFRLPPDLLI